ncbi:MAG: hypothetical protein AAGH74_15135 [Pseudomonadota bacterium]
MIRILLATLALGTAAQAGEAEDVTGEISVFVDGSLNETRDLASVGGEGHVAIRVDPNWGVQMDLFGGRFFDDAENNSFITGGAHLFYTTPQGAVGIATTGGQVGGYPSISLGGEAAYFLENTNFYADVDAICADHFDTCLMNGRLSTQQFLTDNLAIRVSGGYGRFLMETPFAKGALSGTANLDWRMEETPFGLSFAYGYLRLTEGAGAEAFHSLSASVNIHFGTDTLKDHTRTGPLFTDPSPQISALMGGYVGFLDEQVLFDPRLR